MPVPSNRDATEKWHGFANYLMVDNPDSDQTLKVMQLFDISPDSPVHMADLALFLWSTLLGTELAAVGSFVEWGGGKTNRSCHFTAR